MVEANADRASDMSSLWCTGRAAWLLWALSVAVRATSGRCLRQSFVCLSAVFGDVLVLSKGPFAVKTRVPMCLPTHRGGRTSVVALFLRHELVFIAVSTSFPSFFGAGLVCVATHSRAPPPLYLSLPTLPVPTLTDPTLPVPASAVLTSPILTLPVPTSPVPTLPVPSSRRAVTDLASVRLAIAMHAALKLSSVQTNSAGWRN